MKIIIKKIIIVLIILFLGSTTSAIANSRENFLSINSLSAFQVTQTHDGKTPKHDEEQEDEHEHEHEKSYKMHIFLIGSVLLIGALFLWFNRENNEEDDDE